ncbi:MAG: DUF4321 domain-containing protein [Candidatus Krumholzibacteriota bacterium]|nr:DUF4321 domain-containing protein [Candidatus Krumholzibacteriota bacterium]
MPSHRKSFRAIFFTILLGIAVGTIVGDILGMVLPEGIPRDVITYAKSFELAPITLNLLVLSVTFGIGIKFNLMAILGIFVMVQFLKWSW